MSEPESTESRELRSRESPRTNVRNVVVAQNDVSRVDKPQGAARRPAARGREPLYSREMIATVSAGAAFGFAASVFYLLPKYLTEAGMGAAAVGAATSAFGIATVATTPFLALWIDSFGRVTILRVACVLMLLCTAALVTLDGYASLLVVRALQGCAFACFLTALTAHVIDIAPAERLGEALGTAGASMLSMNALAPATAEPIAMRYGWHAAFATATAAAALATLITSRMRERSSASYKPDVSGLVAVLAQPRTIHYAIVTAAIGTAFGVMFTFLQPFAMRIGIGSVRGFFVAYSAFALGSRIAFGRVSDRLDRFRVAVFAINLYTMAVLAAAGLRAGLLEPLGALLGVGHGLFFPAFNAIVMLGAPAGDRGKLATVFTGAFYGGVAVAGLPFGVLAGCAGYPAVFTGAAAVSFAAGALLVFSRALSGEEELLAAQSS